MRYIIESTAYEEDKVLVTQYTRHDHESAERFAQMLRDKYAVDVKIYTEDDYRKLHPNWPHVTLDWNY